MASITSKINRIHCDHGLATLLARAAYALYRRSARRLLPDAGHVMYGDIRVGRTRKVGDGRILRNFLPPDLRDNPTYEHSLIEALRATVRAGDRVTVVGGGEGITASLAALLAGEGGSVLCYEGDRAGIAAVARTAQANGVADRVSCVFAVVGDNVGVFGTDIAERVVAPSMLPACDVLEMDCEGSEVRILRDMTIRPRSIVVETHGFADAPTTLVMEILRGRGYLVEDLGLAEPRQACVDRDEHVVLARLPAD